MIVLSGKRKTGAAVPVYLNVYDLTPINGYAYWLGLGVYHSGVQGFFFFLSASSLFIVCPNIRDVLGSNCLFFFKTLIIFVATLFILFFKMFPA